MALVSTTCPRYSRSDLEQSEPIDVHEDTTDEIKLKCRFEGLGMSSSYSVVLGKSVASGSIGRDKIDGATGMKTVYTVQDQGERPQLIEEELDVAAEADLSGLVLLEEELRNQEQVNNGNGNQNIEYLLCRDVRKSGFISPAFCTAQLRSEKKIMILRCSVGRRDMRLLLPVARDMMKSCCPTYLRSALCEATLDVMSDDSGDDDQLDGLTESVKAMRIDFKEDSAKISRFGTIKINIALYSLSTQFTAWFISEKCPASKDSE